MIKPIKISRRIPARTETFHVVWASRDFMKMTPRFRDIRSKCRYKGDKCWWCKRPFDDGDMMALVAIKGKSNKLFCQKCAGEVKDGSDTGE